MQASPVPATTTHHVVVAGVDGSDRSIAVLSWADEQARSTGARLVAVTAFGGEPASPDWPDDDAATLAQRRLRSAVTAALAPDRAAAAELRVAPQAAGPALAAESEWSDLIVLGAHHRQALHPLRSVVAQVLGAARCPVAVVRAHRPERRGVIVAGINGSPGSSRALHWAVEQAAVTGCAVDAVLAWEWTPEYSVFPYGDRREVVRRSRQAVADGEIERVAAALRDRVRGRAVEGYPVPVLLEAAADADLLVLGTGQPETVTDRVLGTVTERLLRHAVVPAIVVVPGAGEPVADRAG